MHTLPTWVYGRWLLPLQLPLPPPAARSTQRVKEKVPTVQKKPLPLVLSYLGKISLQNRTKLQKSIKGVTVVNYRLFSKVKIKSVIIFASKTLSGVVYKFQSGLCNEYSYGECVRHHAVRSGEQIGI